MELREKLIDTCSEVFDDLFQRYCQGKWNLMVTR